MTRDDWPAVEAIYAEGIATRHATFETAAPSWDEFDTGRHSEHRLVAVESGVVVGWAALSPTSTRACYAGVAEHSVYVARAARGTGAGRAALDAMCRAYAERGFWKIVSRIFPENTASLRLHERCGFRVVGVYQRHGKLDGEWRDCVIVERLL